MIVIIVIVLLIVIAPGPGRRAAVPPGQSEAVGYGQSPY